MKIQVSLSGYAGTESNLISLKNPVANGDYHYFGLNPITHDPNARRTNEQLNAPSSIKRRKKKAKKKEAEATVDLTKKEDSTPALKDDGLGEPANLDHKNRLPNGADMYYGLIPLEHNPVSKMVLSADFGSHFGLGDPVWCQFKVDKLAAQVIAITFIAGKVLYTLAVYTGYNVAPSDYTNQYGLINSLGWDETGNEYIRVSNVDSTFLLPRAIPEKVTIELKVEEVK